MPGYANKNRCRVPDCHAHRDFQLGSRGSGAPPGDLNTRPLPPAQLEHLAVQITAQPGDLHLCIAPIVKTLQDRFGARAPALAP